MLSSGSNFNIPGILLSGKDFSNDIDAHSLFVHIEFESGASIDSIDARLNSLNNLLQGIRGINRIETISRRGSGEMMISFDSALIEKATLVKRIKGYEPLIPNCFIYIPEKGEQGALMYQNKKVQKTSFLFRIECPNCGEIIEESNEKEGSV